MGRALLDTRDSKVSMVSKSMVCLRIKSRYSEGKARVETGWRKRLGEIGWVKGHDSADEARRLLTGG